MMSFRNDRISREPIPMRVAQLIGRIDEFKGRQNLYEKQAPKGLEALREAAMVQSTESSNRIEGIELPERQLRAIVAENGAPKDRPEGEIATCAEYGRATHR